MFCRHNYGEVQGQYQYCKKCGIARLVPHECIWKDKNTYSRESLISGKVFQTTLVQQCTICGEIKQVSIR